MLEVCCPEACCNADSKGALGSARLPFALFAHVVFQGAADPSRPNFSRPRVSCLSMQWFRPGCMLDLRVLMRASRRTLVFSHVSMISADVTWQMRFAFDYLNGTTRPMSDGCNEIHS